MVDKYCWAYILHRDRLAVKSGNQENLLEGTSVACQIIGFGDQNSDTRQRIWCRVQDKLPLQLYSSVISSRKSFKAKHDFWAQVLESLNMNKEYQTIQKRPKAFHQVFADKLTNWNQS